MNMKSVCVFIYIYICRYILIFVLHCGNLIGFLCVMVCNDIITGESMRKKNHIVMESCRCLCLYGCFKEVSAPALIRPAIPRSHS